MKDKLCIQYFRAHLQKIINSIMSFQRESLTQDDEAF